MTTASAFLCHSSIDKGTARAIAEGLLAKGIETFYADWSIELGDSLRRKVEGGIEGARFFVAIISPNSLKSEWVQTELDMALILKIEGKCKLIPLFFQVSPEEAPLTLRSVAGIRVVSIEETVERLANRCHGVSEKPPLGPAPLTVRIPGSNLSTAAARIGIYLVDRSTGGDEHENGVLLSDIALAVELPKEDTEDAVDELDQLGLVKLHPVYDGEGTLFVTPRNRIFWTFDKVVKKVDPAKDAVMIAGLLVNHQKDYMETDLIQEQTGWEPRRINPATTYLVEHGYADPSETINTHPFSYGYLVRTPRTRRFARENAQ